ncbi:hypothetical protein [Fodinicola feengrottensis]|uniref:hypothetical protein n=1 Tax=Fodinicola feengrottensis TaxID=435914 RepID=UPI002442EC88|nr:hypothetical protein [Fodinicola feengrottensis]
MADAGLRLLVKRDDLIHPEMPGNKWRKLKYNLAFARSSGATTLLTFGGAYSNHLGATAAAGAYFGFGTIGVVRGEEHLPLNPHLRAGGARDALDIYGPEDDVPREDASDRDRCAPLRVWTVLSPPRRRKQRPGGTRMC